MKDIQLNDTQVPRITGLLVLEVRKSNPNGDPERESSPRQRPDGTGEISPVSVKRKLRDLMEEKEPLLWNRLKGSACPQGDYEYEILESRERGWKDLKETDEKKRATEAWKRTSKLIEDIPAFQKKYWDGRLFGNTFLEKATEDRGIQNTIRAGVAHFGVGVSVAPIKIEFSTWTKKAPAQEDKTRGMAPMAFRVVNHGLYAIPFFVNPTQARKTGCTERDVELMLQLLRYVYSHTRSVIRTQVEVLHAHAVRHRDPLGSFSDFALLDALAPKRIPREEENRPSDSIANYKIPVWGDIEKQPFRSGAEVKWNEVGEYTDYAL